MPTADAVAILSDLTSSSRVTRRSKSLLKDPKTGSPEFWFMHVPVSFNDALDIKYESSGPNQGWTQAGCFSFKKSDTLYDTDKAYQTWSEALQAIGMSIVVTAASPAGVGEAETENGVIKTDAKGKPMPKPRFSGSVDFRVLLPSIDRSKLEDICEWKMTQDDFVKFIIQGPSGEFKNLLETEGSKRKS